MSYEIVELGPNEAVEAVSVLVDSFSTKPEEGHAWICGPEHRDDLKARKEIYEGAIWWNWHAVQNYGKAFGVRRVARIDRTENLSENQASTQIDAGATPTEMDTMSNSNELLGVVMVDFSLDTGLWMVYREMRTLLRAGTPPIFTPQGRKQWGEWPGIRMIALGRAITRLRERSRLTRHNKEWYISMIGTKPGYEQQ
jgi:hypothetical protein